MKAIVRWATIILFAIFPILFVYFRNESFIFEGGLIWPIAIVSGACLGLYVILNLINKKGTNNVIIVLFVAAWFLFYGHIYYFLLDTFHIKYTSLRHRYFLPLYSILFIIPVWFTWKAKEVPDKLINVFFIIGLTLNIQFVSYIVNSFSAKNNSTDKSANSEAKTDLPDVYYIILDSYTNEGNLKKYYKYDNSAFIKNLKELGFTVFDSARSNYPYTYFSLPSSLNMEYINYFEDSVSIKKKNENFPFSKIHHNKVAAYFKAKGYKYVLFPSAYDQLNDRSQADVYIEHKIKINSYYESLIQLSVLTTLNLEFYVHEVYDLCKKTLSLLPKTPDMKGNKFVFFHCLPPHPPHVFDENGNYVYTDQNVENRYKQLDGYVNQVKYINKEMLKITKSILEKSKNPPIIIIQGDHGSASSEESEDENKWQLNPSKELLQERFGILNAIYIPEKYKINFPKNHTPVNTFRLILNKLFNDTMQPLPGKSYFARYRKNYNFREVNWPAVESNSIDSLLRK